MLWVKDDFENVSNRRAATRRSAVVSILIASISLSGCAVKKPYAQNPFNPDAKLSDIDGQPQTSSSDSRLSKAAGLGIAVANRPIPNAIPHGAEIGIAAALLLGPGNQNKPTNGNYVFASMPATLASDENAAKIKLSSIIEKGITQALQPEYQFKIEEYNDTYAFGGTLRPRWLRVDGPLCENWSCQIIAPIPAANALQWQGDVTLQNGIWKYAYPKEQSIAFLKIVNEFDKDGLFNNRRHHVEGFELANFDYLNFLTRVSANLPEWVYIEWTPLGKTPLEIHQGIAKPVK